jgi:tRNA1Val (adenine37-N6)-methyltransferase
VSDSHLTRDAFLGGRLQIWQPAHGYRAGTDPVLLAAACPARPGERVLELGCGVGVASLCLACRVEGLSVIGVERQADYADLAARNAREADLPVSIVTADIAKLPADLREMSFDHVIANPPYFKAGSGTAASDAGREASFREDTDLSQWAGVARARLRPRGWLTMIQLAERLPDVLAVLGGFGSISVRPLQSRIGRPAGRFLLRARKGGRAPFQLLAPILVHEHAAHTEDADSYTPEVQAVLRDAGALDWPDGRKTAL